MSRKIGVLLSGCGVYDGAEIHESVLTLLAISELACTSVCIGINSPQHHVINHFTGEEMNETRNMLIEGARIARGQIVDLQSFKPAQIDALVIPGGFGSAKNLTSWAFDGPDGTILPEVKELLTTTHRTGKPIGALCVSPVVVAKAFAGAVPGIEMTLGSDQAPSPYDIKGFSAGLAATGACPVMKAKDEIQIDQKNKIVSAPCYMMETDLATLRKNIYHAVEAVVKLI